MLYDYKYGHKGFYKVGQQAFRNKLEACLAANKLGSDVGIHWDYHEDVFNNVNWTNEPPVSIEEIYRQRALQLREQYDYLVLLFSGGADSTTILQTFIKNNIPIDEVFVFGAWKAEEKVIDQLGWDRAPGYYTRELNSLALPWLRELQKTHKFKVTTWDWTDKAFDMLDNPDWIWDAGTRFAPDAIFRQELHRVCGHQDRYDEKGIRTGFIFGIDKPRLYRDDENIYIAFIDLILTTAVGNTADIHRRDWENDEYFYWSPNMPDLVVKQAHMIMRDLKATNRLDSIAHIGNLGSWHNANYYNVINPIVYPGWDMGTWQIKKPTHSVRDEFCKWFYDYAPQDKQKKWLDSLGELERMLGKRWFNQGSAHEGLVGSFSKFYKVGTVN